MDRFGEFGDIDSERLPVLDTGIEPPSPVGADERRMHVRAYNHWVSLLRGAPFPSVDDLDLEATGDFGPHSVLLDFTRDIENPAVVWLGERLRTECDLPPGVSHLADVPPRSLLSRLTDHHLQIIANRAPIGFEAEFVNGRGNTAMYRGILLPFSSTGDAIDFIYGVINWKEMAPAALAAQIHHELTAGPAAAAPAPRWADGPNTATPPPAPLPPALADDEPEPEFTSDSAPETLADRLALARASAEAASGADARGRQALYAALAEAYDFALAADDDDADYRELLADAGLRPQARAPMTPVVKLVFGAGYDKTRLTEFAAALAFGKRRGLPAGGMQLFLTSFPGGLKAVVAAERRERRPGSRVEHADPLFDAARALPSQAMLSLPGDDEFALLVVRRVDAGKVAVVGVVPDDRPLLGRAIKGMLRAT